MTTAMSFDEVVAEVARVRAGELRRWVHRGWVRPARRGRAWRFAEIDVARVRLICDLRHDLTIDEDAIAVVLDLVDQVYELRRQLHTVLGVLGEAPEPVRRTLQQRLAERMGAAGGDEP